MSAAAATVGWQPITLPWGAWYAEAPHQLLLPPAWTVSRCAPADAPAMSPAAIRDAIQHPLDSPTLRELARQAQSVCIAIDDLARPTQTALILPHVLEALLSGGIPESAMRIVVATGTHGPPDASRLALKIGADVLRRVRAEVHDPSGILSETPIEYGGAPLRINRAFYEADLKIGIGSALPHPFAGYGGGAKLLVPGLSDLPATERTHKFVRMGLRGGADPDQNRFRLEIEQIARQLQYAFTICCVPNSRCETSALFAGDVVSAHRSACGAAARTYRTSVAGECDCLFVNAYPKDTDLVQSLGVLSILKGTGRPILRDGGVVVLSTAATCGVGTHGLFGPGGRNYRSPETRSGASKFEVWLYAPGASEAEARLLHPREEPFFQDPLKLALALRERLGDEARAGVFPCAPLQQIDIL